MEERSPVEGEVAGSIPVSGAVTVVRRRKLMLN